MLTDVTTEVRVSERQNNAYRKKAVVLNPQNFLVKALEKINYLFNQLESKQGTTIRDFEMYLQEREPGLKRKIDACWDSIDTDIYTQYYNGTMTETEIMTWKKHLDEWKRTLSKAVELYRMHLPEIEGSDVPLAVEHV